MVLEEEKNLPNTGVNEAWDYGDEYAFGEEVNFIIPKIEHNIWPTTNQAWLKETVSACTIVGSLNQIIRLFGIDMNMTDANKLSAEVVNYCTKYGYMIGYGWSTPDALNVVCKWRNEIGAKRFNKEKVFYVRLDYTNSKVREALDKGHLVGFTYALNFGDDRKAGWVYKESYPGAVGHRTNWKGPQYTVATGGAKNQGADVGVHDSYYSWTNQYFIKNRKPYMGKGMYTPAYLVMPQSAMIDSTVEEEKKRIAELKAVNAVIATLTSTWGDLPEWAQELSASYAKKLREEYEDARPLYDNQEEKVYQSVTDMLSYSYKFANEKYQQKYAELASELRGDFNLK